MREQHSIGEAAGPVWDLAPASDIRRRGELRIRRRRFVHVAAAVVAVVAAALAGPVVMWSGVTAPGDVIAGTGSHEVSSGDTRHLQAGSPSTIDLATGMRSPRVAMVNGRDERMLSTVTVCSDAAWAERQADVASLITVASGSDAAGSPERRVLLSYPDERSARDALEGVRRTAATCATDGARERTILLAVGDEPETWSWVHVVSSGAGLGRGGSLLAARVGTTVLISQRATDAAASASTEDRLSYDVLQVLQDMCEQSTGPC